MYNSGEGQGAAGIEESAGPLAGRRQGDDPAEKRLPGVADEAPPVLRPERGEIASLCGNEGRRDSRRVGAEVGIAVNQGQCEHPGAQPQPPGLLPPVSSPVSLWSANAEGAASTR